MARGGRAAALLRASPHPGHEPERPNPSLDFRLGRGFSRRGTRERRFWQREPGRARTARAAPPPSSLSPAPPPDPAPGSPAPPAPPRLPRAPPLAPGSPARQASRALWAGPRAAISLRWRWRCLVSAHTVPSTRAPPPGPRLGQSLLPLKLLPLRSLPWASGRGHTALPGPRPHGRTRAPAAA